MSDGNDQYRFGDDGELKEPNDEDEEERTDDFGEEIPYWQTAGGYRRDVVVSLLQSALRRSDPETAPGVHTS